MLRKTKIEFSRATGNYLKVAVFLIADLNLCAEIAICKKAGLTLILKPLMYRIIKPMHFGIMLPFDNLGFAFEQRKLRFKA